MRSSQVLSESLRTSAVTNRHLKRRQMLDRAAEALILVFASIAMAIILLIFVYVGREALPLLWALHRAVGAQVSLLRAVAGLTDTTAWLRSSGRGASVTHEVAGRE